MALTSARKRLKTCASLTALLLLSPVSWAQQNDENQEDNSNTETELAGLTELDEITVTATRSERQLEDAAGTVSVIDEEDIERNIVRDIQDLIRNEPGVAVDGTGSRFGLTGFRIRGIGEDRVLTLIDGIRIADEFSFGPFQDSNRDFVDIDAVKSVEIIRGPASSLYGSDAIGGVVSFITKDPEDYLNVFNKNFYISGKAGYSSEDNSWLGTLTLAGEQGPIQGMLLYTRREGDETETHGGRGGTGPERQQANPQDFETNNILAKLIFKPNDQHEFKLTYEGFEDETKTNVLSEAGDVVFGTITEQAIGIDEGERDRWSLDYRYSGETAAFDSVKARIYHQASETDQRTEQLRNSLISGRTFRTRRSFFEQELQGIDLQFDKSFQVGEVDNYLTYGVEFYTVEGDNLRDGATFDAQTDVSIPERFPFPTRAFPLSETTQYAFYIQNEIELLDGRLTLVPGIRYDNYELEAKEDAVYTNSNPGIVPPEDFDDAKISPKLGAIFRIDETWSLFAQYAQGFRAPPYDDVNVGFTNIAGGYKTIPNPELKPETSDSFELGIRANASWGSLSVAGFYNKYDNFIESLAPQGIDPDDGLLVFRAENRGEVTIKGLELKSQLFLDHFSEKLSGWNFKTSIAYAEGDDEDINQPLNSIDPIKAVFGLGYDHSSDNWGGELIWTVVSRKTRVDQSDPNFNQFKSPGYGKLDLTAYYQIDKHSRINAGVFNITDKKYWNWGEGLIGRDASDSGLDRLTQPGLHAGITFRMEW